MRRVFLGIAVLSLLLSSGCSPAGGSVGQQVARIAPPVGEGGFVVQPGDVLRLRIWPDEQAISGDYPVEETGVAYLPRLGAVDAGGNRIDQVRATLRQRYAQEAGLRTPVITVTPIFRVSILGAIARPGVVLLDPTRSVYDVISEAGGLTDAADEDAILIVRDGAELHLNAVDEATLLSGTYTLQLQSGDRIFVPSRPAPLFSYDDLRSLLQLTISTFTLWRVLTRD
jgi:protein involved in polysaccharide export with SLBB domain